jgi:hypothetical protein
MVRDFPLHDRLVFPASAQQPLIILAEPHTCHMGTVPIAFDTLRVFFQNWPPVNTHRALVIPSRQQWILLIVAFAGFLKNF